MKVIATIEWARTYYYATIVLQCGHKVSRRYKHEDYRVPTEVRCKIRADSINQISFPWREDGKAAGAVDAGLDVGSSDQSVRGEE